MTFTSIYLVLYATLAAAENLLFAQLYPAQNLATSEYSRALDLGLSIKVVEPAEWYNMTTEDFAAFNAIIIADSGSSDKAYLDFLTKTKDVWGPAVEGNVILIGIAGTDPTNHCCSGSTGLGAGALIDNSILFAAAGVAPGGIAQTGLYMAMSYYYAFSASIEDGYVESLSHFGNFTMQGASCYNDIHLVSTSPALATLTDDALSNWDCSVHEIFFSYPPDFQALAIARDVTDPGPTEFGDGTFGVPYIVARGATPAKCGDGVWDKNLGEECDDGNTRDGDGCDKSCRCEEGYQSDGNGKCLAPTASASETSASETSASETSASETSASETSASETSASETSDSTTSVSTTSVSTTSDSTPSGFITSASASASTTSEAPGSSVPSATSYYGAPGYPISSHDCSEYSPPVTYGRD